MTTRTLLLVLVVFCVAHPTAAQTTGRACAELSSFTLPKGIVTVAEAVAAGQFTPPGGAAAQTANPLPAFCRVAATLKPSADSNIAIEVWLPAGSWNGKLQAVGNGAFNGNVPYGAMMAALRRGYAAAGTDTGHVGGGAQWALGHPEKVIDFGWRAVHEMTVAAKAIVAAHYAAGPRYSYWNGCSAGGRQAMKAAQRFPDDFDGIIAGAPGLDWTGRAAQANRVAKVLSSSDAARLLERERRILHTAVVGACDALDGVKDGLIENPEACTFDPGVLACRASNGTDCLTPAQVETARLIYSSAKNPKTNRNIAGLLPGSELGWTDLGWTESARATGIDQFRYIVYGDPAWTLQQFTFETDIARADDVDRDTINALDPNLKPFFDSGGKLIQYHGWSDPQISPANSVQYYKGVTQALGESSRVHDSYRLFMAPGMGHCGGGQGPNTFDMVTALEQWVEHGKAPDRISASHSTGGKVDRTRPLCPYPQTAVYKGTGSIDAAENFECRAPSR
jgi:feruloyl esterase